MKKDSGKKMKEMRVDGGMVKNINFIQFLSNVLQINIIRPKNVETSALGAAYLAGLYSGIIKDTTDLEKFWKYESKFKPTMTKKTRNNLLKNWNYHIHKLINY
jgi:glycerol kinase